MAKKAMSYLEKAARKEKLANVDLSKRPDQKRLINKMMVRMGEEPLTKNPTNDVLARIDHQVAGELLDYRKLNKALDDLDGYKSLIHSDTNRLHPVVNYLNLTGRITMDNPPLQMVQKTFTLSPHSTNKDKSISMRNIFRAQDGFTFVAGDYSQLELRILASFSEDDKLIAAFNATDARDPFREVGKDWFDKAQITEDERNQVKRCLYGKLNV